MSEEEVKALQAQLEAEKAEKAKLEETNKRLYARTKEAEGFTQDPDTGEWVKKPKQPETTTVNEQPVVPKPSDILKAPEFRLHRQGYTEEDIDLIMHNGGPDILKNENHPITLGINAARAQRKAEEAASNTTDSVGLSDIERKYTEQDLRKMPKEELEKMLPHVQH